ncbi:MAG: flagellar motor protein MotB [Candidatus Neomarinimicrobiota bacterium]|nr:MAG: flagellar motor protein MotB [Candidatus Neomarinimicrobiota bacterium]
MYEEKNIEITSEEKEEQPWLLTYGDMMTLLLTFFVLLFSMSTIDPVKLEMFSNSMGKALGKKKTKTYSLSEIYKQVVQVVEQENLKDVIEVETSPRGVAIKIPSEITFESGSAVLDPRIYPILDKLEPLIRKSVFPIAVEGHTDNVPITSNTYPSNWELSSARACEVVKYYIRRGVDPKRFQAIGYAYTRPRAPGKTIEEANSTEAKRAQNRRVEIVFLTME